MGSIAEEAAPALPDPKYVRFSDQPIANPQVFIDEGCILDLDAEGRLVGVEILDSRTLADVLPAILSQARFRSGIHR